MPGLTVVDGTPRDCPSAGCGAQDDTAIIRANEAGTAKASAMGRTKANGPVTADRMMAIFMDTAGGTFEFFHLPISSLTPHSQQHCACYPRAKLHVQASTLRW